MTEESNNEQLFLKKTEGFMYKKGGAVNKGLGGRRNWLKRWFTLDKVITRGRTTYTLNYYEAPKGKQKGSVDLEGTEIFCERRTQHTNKNVRYEFQIQLQNGSLLQLSCDDFKERDEWIESLNYAIASMRKPVIERPTFIKVAHAGYDPNLDDKEENYRLGEEIAQNCQAYGSGLYGAEAGQPAEFMIQVCNPEGKQLTTGGLPFTANLYDDTCLYHIGVHDKGNGTLSSFYVLSRPGKYELSILLNDEHHIYGSPFTVEVLPSSTSPNHCIAIGDCIEKKILPDVVSTFTIIAMDSYGNKKQRGGDPFEVGVMGPAKLLGLEDKGDGTYVCSLEAFYPRDQPYLTTASISVMVTLHGKPIHDSPFRPAIDMTARINSNFNGNKLQSNSNININNTNGTGNNIPFSTPSNTLSSRNLGNNNISNNVNNNNNNNNNNSQLNRISDKEQKPPRPLEIPPGSNKLEAARLRALEAVKDTPPTTQELVAMAMQTNNNKDNSNNNANNNNNNNNSNGNFGNDVGGRSSLTSQQNNLLNTNSNTAARLGKIDQMMNSTNPKSLVSRNDTNRNHSQSINSNIVNNNNNNNTNTANNNNLPPKGSTSAGNKLSTRMSKLDLMTQQLGTSKIFQPQGSSSNNQPPPSSLSNNARNAPPPQPAELMESLSAGLVIPPPEDLPNELRRLWSITHEAFGSRDIIQLLATNAVALQSSFNLAAEPPSYRLAFLLSETGNSAGLYKLFEEFDVIPAYMNKKELKILFEMIVRSQSHSGPPPASFVSSQGKEGIEFIYFMKLLVMVALFTLSKTQAFNSLYSTVKAKTDVMLFNWGFADPLKIRSIQDRL